MYGQSFIVKRRCATKRGFTLLELIIVIIIVGILATFGFTQYSNVVEKGRMAEAYNILGTIRVAELVYRLENASYGTISQIGISGIPTTSVCDDDHYFYYAADPANPFAPNVATATRCSNGRGKAPSALTSYFLVINFESGIINTSTARRPPP